MSASINISLALQLLGGLITHRLNPPLIQIAQSVNLKLDEPLSVPTTGVQPTFAAITTPGIIVLYNPDPTNYVKYGPYIGSTQEPFGIIMPGGYALFQVDTATQLSFTAHTATVVLEVLVLNT